MKALVSVSIGTLLLCSCASSITDVPTQGRDQACVRECTKSYSACVSGANIGYNTGLFNRCHDAYAACVQTCPSAPDAVPRK